MKMTKVEGTRKKNDHEKEAPLVKSEEGEGEPKESRGKEEEEGGLGEKKTVVVGVKTEAQSRELLTWALVNVAAPGDRVVALHVHTSGCRSFSDPEGEGEREPEPAVAISPAKGFDAMLAVYEGFCNLKQVPFFPSKSYLFSTQFALFLIEFVPLFPDRSKVEDLQGNCGSEGFGPGSERIRCVKTRSWGHQAFSQN